MLCGHMRGWSTWRSAQPSARAHTHTHTHTHAELLYLILRTLLQVPETISREWRPAQPDGLPAVFTGGFVGYAGYDTVRYVYSGERVRLTPSQMLSLHPAWSANGLFATLRCSAVTQ